MKDNPPLAFHAPMKSPHSPRPSGDRTLAMLFSRALSMAGFTVSVASEFRSWEGRGDRHDQARIQREGRKAADSLLESYRRLPEAERPVAWFSYHLYHKSPDLLGPPVCRALGIPYFIAEASISSRHAEGPWREGFHQSVNAINLARRIFNLNPRDLAGLKSLPGSGEKIIPLLPFLDAEPASPAGRNSLRQRLASRLRIDPDRYWLLCVGMMRDDSKLRSYEQLARTLGCLERKDWLILIVGDGAAELQVRDYFRLDMDRQIYFLGRRDKEFVRQVMGAADLLVWPAINEAIGMVTLEALAAGLPVVCGHSGGIGQIVQHRQTGLLVEDPAREESAKSFARAIESLLENPATLAAMSANSLQRYQQHHRMECAAHTLRSVMLPFIRSRN
jgi:glycosyltransferase involved in cell wall biosynthesis